MDSNNRAVAYIRVSTQEQVVSGVSLDAQEARIRAYCTMAGLELVALVREEGVSGSKPLNDRDGGASMLQLMREHKAGHVVALKLDRLFRDAADALNLTRTWDKAGIALHLVDVGGQTINTATAMGRMFLTMMAGFAELERNLTSERTAAALGHKKTNRKAYAPTPMGYTRDGNDLHGDPAELATVARIKAMRLSGHTLGYIAATLNAEGVPTKRGGQWYPSTVTYIVKNNLYTEAIAHA